jgi:hypothetical protein
VNHRADTHEHGTAPATFKAREKAAARGEERAARHDSGLRRRCRSTSASRDSGGVRLEAGQDRIDATRGHVSLEGKGADVVAGGDVAAQILRNLEHSDLVNLAGVLEEATFGVLHFPGAAVFDALAEFVHFENLDDGLHRKYPVMKGQAAEGAPVKEKRGRRKTLKKGEGEWAS